MRDLDSSDNKMDIGWMVIPKGVAGKEGAPGARVLKLTAMAVFRQESFSAHGPFDAAGAHGNWPAWVKQNLRALRVVIGGAGTEQAYPAQGLQQALAALAPELWSDFFGSAKRVPRGRHQARSAAASSITLRDTSSAFARTAQDIIGHLVVHQLAAASDSKAVHAEAGHGAPTIDTLFPPAAGDARASVAPSWLGRLQAGYGALADIFLPPQPSLDARLDAAGAQAVSKLVASPEADLLKSFDEAYRPQPPRPRDARSVQPDSPIGGLVQETRHGPMLSAASSSLVLDRMRVLAVHGPGQAVAALPAGNGHPWAQQAIDHMIGAIPYRPDPTKAHDSERYGSEQNRLAMLQAEPGILSAIGVVFDLEVDLVGRALAPLTPIRIEPDWKAGNAFTDLPQTTVMNASGTPASRLAALCLGSSAHEKAMRSVYDERGYLKLGALDHLGEPQFMLSDFRIDEAFLQLQNAAQADHNKLPEVSPGASRATLERSALNEVRSHDLVLHWTMRPDLAVAQRSGNCKELYLDDLVIGIRPQLGRMQGERIAWYDLTAREVEYRALRRPRSAADRARDDGFVPLASSDKRNDTASTVSEALCVWSGWGIGLSLPGAAASQSPLGKIESARPGSLPPLRFGDQVWMAARLVLRDGSSLQTAAQATCSFGASAAGRDTTLSVGARDRSGPIPFRLLRWERLKAPAVLLDGPLKAPGWWPAESATRMVVATAFQQGRGGQRSTRRYLAPDREADMLSVWKHGVFDDGTSPRESAFGNVARDEHGGFTAIDSGVGGREAAFRPTGGLEGRQRIPYHPDPLVTALRIYAARRVSPASRHWLPVCDDAGRPILAEFELYGRRGWPHAREVMVELHAVERGQRPLFRAERPESELHVYLPQGETMVLVVAPMGAADTLSAKHAFGPARLEAVLSKFGRAALGGLGRRAVSEFDPARMQFLTNLAMIDIQHALDRPLQRPALALTPVVRPLDATWQDFAARVRFDPGSTGTVEVYGTWTEQEGSIERQARAHQRTGRGVAPAVLCHLAARFEQRELEAELIDERYPAGNIVARKPLEKDLRFQDELHDHKHREIVYWTRGISSASAQAQRRSGNPDLGWPTLDAGREAALADLAAGTGDARHIFVPASRKPKPPSLMYLLPAFAFHTENTRDSVRRTRNSVLAVHMDCDWFDSGNGEALALVLLKRPGGGEPYNKVRERCELLASFWGANPVKQGEGALVRLPDYLESSHLGGSPPIVHATLDVPGSKPVELRLALYRPDFCAEVRSWRAEVAVTNPSGVSRPFVRLAFCRYQAHALPGCQMSDIVVADHTQLSDQRELQITRNPADDRHVGVTVYGISFEGSENSAQARVLAWLERRCAGQVHDPEAAWVPDGEPSELPRSVREGRACWHGILAAAEPIRGSRYRVAIVEEESYRRDREGQGRDSIPVYFDLLPLDW